MAIGSGLGAQIGLVEEVYTNEVQTITGTPSATFGLNFDGALTPVTLTTTATAASIQTALNNLPNIGANGVVCTGGPLPSQVTVTFSGPLVSKRNVPALTVQGSITGLTFATPTPGTGYGDFQTPTRFLELDNETIQLEIQRIESAALRSNNRVLRLDRWAANKKQAAGDIMWEPTTTGFGMLFKHMLGAVNITGTAIDGTSLTSAKNMVFTVADPTGLSLTIQVGRPDTGTPPTVRPFTYLGCKLVSWEFNQALDALLSLKTTIDAADEDTTVNPLAAASYPASQNNFDYTEGTLTIAGANFAVRSFDLVVNQALNTSRYFIRNNTKKKEPLPNALMDITGTLEAEFTDLSAYNRFLNGTLAAVTMTWTGPALPAPDAGENYVLKITLPQVRFDGTTPNVAGADILSQPLPFKCLWDGTTSPITINYQTSDTAV